MKVDVITQCGLTEAIAVAQRCERLGFDRLIQAEVANNPFLPLCLAASGTSRIEMGTGIAVAFARSPMTVAVTSSNIHRQSRGRFALGLGTQIKPHVTRRFSMPWHRPAPQMREYIGALRAIWASWDTGQPLRFEGEFYSHTLMTPMFDHGPSDVGTPPIFLAGVGPVMTALAAEVADGYLAHGFSTPHFMREVTAANLARGLDKREPHSEGRQDFEVSAPLFLALGHDEAQLAGGLEIIRHTLAFYGSTPAYRPVLEHHGWGALGEELTKMSKSGQWAEMGALIDDEVMSTFSIIGAPEDFAAELERRYGGLLDRVQIGLPEGLSDDVIGQLVESVRRIPSRAELASIAAA